MSDLTPFDEITAALPQLSPFQALWNEARELLAESRLHGFEVEEIGRIAWDCLPEAERPAAFDALFYAYWEAEQDRAARARFEAAGGAL
ncbi:hypothetical protein ABZX82_01675 [Streptomyces griseoflavus]|uniref:hypothetical protein n=1 Tax=Streptomyces griseoflavus TaxID=35619 RepID=UPI0033B8B96C